jgi:hypothetical protein
VTSAAAACQAKSPSSLLRLRRIRCISAERTCISTTWPVVVCRPVMRTIRRSRPRTDRAEEGSGEPQGTASRSGTGNGMVQSMPISALPYLTLTTRLALTVCFTPCPFTMTQARPIPEDDVAKVVAARTKEWHFHIYYLSQSAKERAAALALRDAVLKLRNGGERTAYPQRIGADCRRLCGCSAGSRERASHGSASG